MLVKEFAMYLYALVEEYPEIGEMEVSELTAGIDANHALQIMNESDDINDYVEKLIEDPII